MVDRREKDSKNQEASIIEPPLVASRSQMPASPHNTVDVAKETGPGPIKLRFLSLAMLAIVSVAAGFAGGWFGARDDGTQTIQKQQVVLKSQGDLISSIAKEVGSSVVSVEVSSQGAPANDFFGFQGLTEQQSAGTGIIIDKNGLVITNRHVVPQGATKVSITLSDGTKFDNVQVVGRTSDSDPLDIAFLKITDTKGKTLTAAKIGDSSKVNVGDSVVAIGNALGQFQNTVTSGIISGYGRNIEAGASSGGDTETLQNLFQTDAAINEGNSGGPLVNLDGEVIGINTAVAGGGAQNIGFALPINDIKGVMQSVLDNGKLERPFLGVVYITITADLAKQYELKVDHGAYIPPSVTMGQDTVVNDGPADKAGIQEGDILTKVGNKSIDEKHSLTSLLGQHKVGDKVSITLVRGGKERTVDVTLSAAPNS